MSIIYFLYNSKYMVLFYFCLPFHLSLTKYSKSDYKNQMNQSKSTMIEVKKNEPIKMSIENNAKENYIKDTYNITDYIFSSIYDERFSNVNTTYLIEKCQPESNYSNYSNY